MQTITLLNPKGGCGKTTLATNLAVVLADEDHPTVLYDHDWQASSSRWLNQRPSALTRIVGLSTCRVGHTQTKTWQLRPPCGARWAVADTPAALRRPQLDDLVARSDRIIIPVIPSPIDVDALASFVAELRTIRRVRAGTVPVVAVINRVPVEKAPVEKAPVEKANDSSAVSLPGSVGNANPSLNAARLPELGEFSGEFSGEFLELGFVAQISEALNTMGVPIVARLRESIRYVQAAAEGWGIHEMPTQATLAERAEWVSLVNWVKAGNAEPVDAPATPALAPVLPATI